MIVAETTGVSLAQADEVRRALGTPKGQHEIEAWWRPAALRARLLPRRPSTASGRCSRRSRRSGSARRTPRPSPCRPTTRRGSRPTTRRRSSPGCSPTTRACTPSGSSSTTPARSASRCSASTSTPRPAATASSGSTSRDVPRRRPGRRHRAATPADADAARCRARTADLPDASAYGIRLSLADVRGISEARSARIVAGQPYAGLADFWHRAHVSRPVAERLVLAGGFDSPLRHGRRGRRSGRTRAGPPGATCCSTSPSSTATVAGAGPLRPQRPAPRHGRGARAVPAASAGARAGRGARPGRRAVAGGAAGARRRRSSRPSSPSTSATGPSSPAAPGCPS